MNAQREPDGRLRQGTLEWACYGMLAIWPALALCGCSAVDLPTYYGQHERPALSASVNGTDVLAKMFIEAGHEVYFRRTLVTSQMEAADTIVWFPDDRKVPSEEVCQWFENWLYEKPGRTLVFVGRDFNAAPLYWKAMTPKVSAEQKQAYKFRSLADSLASKQELDDKQRECAWFKYELSEDGIQDISKLGGPWSREVDAAKTQMQLGTKLIPTHTVQKLLTSGDEILVSRYSPRPWEGSKILFVANGSFSLNLPLVNHEHRKLAGQLIEAAGEPGRVVFLESGPLGPPIDPAYTDNSLWTLFGAWPLNVILLQLAVAGVIFCYARWPIFGRPRQPAPESTSDFGLHVAAVGQLLSRTKDRQFALERVQAAAPSGAERAQTRQPPPAATAPQPSERKG